jgi:hypothetical protein
MHTLVFIIVVMIFLIVKKIFLSLKSEAIDLNDLNEEINRQEVSIIQPVLQWGQSEAGGGNVLLLFFSLSVTNTQTQKQKTHRFSIFLSQISMNQSISKQMILIVIVFV